MKLEHNVVWHNATVTRIRREKQNAHKSVLLWFTGLPQAGKSTIAHALEEHLFELGCHTYALDGDNVRHGLCKDLGFSQEDRAENIRRIGEAAKLFLDAGVITLAAFVSPYRKDREQVRQLLNGGEFVEIYCKCPVSVCEQRDTKGHYEKARQGIIKNFTGVSAPYEEPVNAEIVLETHLHSIEECAQIILDYLMGNAVLQRAAADKPSEHDN